MKNIEKRYQKALDYIYSFVDYSRTHHHQLSSDDFNLTRMEEFVARLGSPHHDYDSIHVAGSKGKGSVSALCASALRAQGYRVGLYTSPHLKDFEERMQINGSPIPREKLVKLIEEIRPVIDSFQFLTTFEIMTGLCFLYFSREQVDLAVVEVGLGGRLDSTNVISPLISVITALFLDHVTILGETIEEIAAEKGGIIKPGIPVVVAPQESSAANRILEGIAHKQQSPLLFVDREYAWQKITASLEGQRFRVVRSDQPADDQGLELEIPLLGNYQAENALTAYAVLKELNQQEVPVRDAAIQQGFKQVDWPGRFEVLRRDPPVIVDSAHNPASCRHLISTIDEFFPEKPVVLIFGISEDKQLQGMLQELLPRVSQVITTQADHPRAMDADRLAEVIQSWGTKVDSVPEGGEALSRGLQLADRQQAVLLITGSIFVAATLRIAWINNLERRGDSHPG